LKGIILAGGSGSRLHPITTAVGKQLLPVYDKPMIYYPLSVLMQAGIQDILIISTPTDVPRFQALLGDGSQIGLRLSYLEQAQPNGIGEALIIGAPFVATDPVALILGDNLFYGPHFDQLLRSSMADLDGCALFGSHVDDASPYGVARRAPDGHLEAIEEKPPGRQHGLAVTGLYMYENSVLELARQLAPSARGELEITDINNEYVKQGRADLYDLGDGFTWLDTGTFDALLDAGALVRTIQKRHGLHLGCIEEIALDLGYITPQQCAALGAKMRNSSYGAYVASIPNQGAPPDASDPNEIWE
jgi:glucose-1-phosphate thymidylyltransferase